MSCRYLYTSVLFATMCLFGGCSPSIPTSRPGASTVPHAVVSDSNDSDIKTRITDITNQLSRSGKLPSVLLDANFLEEKVGDGFLGPADYFAFYTITIPVADIPVWRTALSTSPVLNGPAAYAKPMKNQPWWLTEEEFGKLELFGPKPLTGRVSGWIGISPVGTIYIYSFST